MKSQSEILLSIITPTFNSERFVERCLLNVIEQNVSGIEHLVMDGLSKDNTTSIVEQIAEQYDHIRLVSEKDSGQSNAMNKGIERARGKFICFLNVDDYFEPKALSFALEQMKECTDRHILVGNCNVVDISGKLQTVRAPSDCGYPQILEFWRGDVFPPNPSSYFYARHLHDSAGLYDEDEHYVLDYEMMIRLLKVGKVKYVNRTLGNFVLHEDTKTHINSSAGIRITKLAVFQRYIKELPVLQRWRLQLGFFYHMRLMRSNHPIIFFAMRPLYAMRRIFQKISQ